MSFSNPASAETVIETFHIGSRSVPRPSVGLWQRLSPQWGTAPLSKIKKRFQALVEAGFTEFDMADHYGDAELLFGRFRTRCEDRDRICCATKICLFEKVDPTDEVMNAALSQRIKNVKAQSIDLCQFYVQHTLRRHYDNGEHFKALQYLHNDTRVSSLGAVDFDTLKMEQALAAGIALATNQVQFSLIDSRPTVKMGPLCVKHGVKLLKYGTLCGGFLADKWVGESAPALCGDGMTPSHRKIVAWGGWDLFHELLEALNAIAKKHGLSVSNVATRWVLDHEYVGAVIVGTRLGVSDRTDENPKVYGWRLDDGNLQKIEEVLQKSRREEMFEQMGDCGMEYIH
ncbi:putative general stress protein [Phyllosticta citriasiana]|uniref:putative general stress protein n=1 Tax=Phyllosticta citriasiana TaxID=595635 RepID=UPI0030FD7402